MRVFYSLKSCVLCVGLVAGLSVPAVADGDDHDYDHDDMAAVFIHGAPSHPSDAWVLAAGGRIYDNWMEALDRDAPEGTHPAYPAGGKQSGETTWRCKECHGWDYLGVEGIYREGSHHTGIMGIRGASGGDEAGIAAALRAEPHGYTPQMISDDELARVAAFVARGQVDLSAYINLETRTVIPGDIDRGRAVFQTTCAACHGFDGRNLDWGDADSPAYVGTEAVAAPDEVMNKILNAHPGVEMINLRAFGADFAGDVLTYISTLPQD
ncbi:c-type cytochrome [Antarctobacter heliothermus]|uniref:Cytochrome C oxidase, cbb3-type, subunit III n=1 Tax=Antarctobacter heliothermus TaxID=74033 RepID=A0A239I6D1_9RHOB|nr:c-type cytochrome [Antarctobacter heliothermus]SNS87904.1 Cytochrome C oxidase, cbb3-type, subunit III [Antarctobacter heliothermus]